MAVVTIYHNPRCSKSRQTLSLLKDHGVEPEVVEYLREPLDAATLQSIVEKFAVDARDLIRTKEFNELNADEPTNDAEWIALMVQHPEIIQRPIVVAGSQAALGRPPENVLAII